MRMRSATATLVLVIGCGDPNQTDLVDGIALPPLQAGYTRFVAPSVMDLKPGDDVTYCQWLTEPADADRMVADMNGYQSTGGHHFTLYASTVKEKVGTSRPCTQEDMLSVSFLGAVGGEGNGADVVKLPPGLGFKLPKGSAIMANAHYLNAGMKNLNGSSVVDVKLAEESAALRPVGYFVLYHPSFQIPARTPSYTSGGSCQAPQKLRFFMWGNHLHEYGVSVFSELKRQDGSKLTLAADAKWAKEDTYNTPWRRWDMAKPVVVEAGDTLSLSCTWANDTNAPIDFPREMCTASGFVLEPIEQTICETK